jgi:energy-coupling factor transporter ATP-binding protein EcfA2
MLKYLTIRDFVIVDTLELDFSPGFTALTGETGAGKSILIDALSFALGERGDSTLVRSGCERAEIAAEFDAPASLALWLDAAGFAPDESGRLLLRRTIDAQGRSRAWVNGSPATLAQLREAAARYPRPPELGQLEISITPRGMVDVDTARRYADLGVQRLVFVPAAMEGPAIDATITQVAETLIGRL